jgi:hypothetical protein
MFWFLGVLLQFFSIFALLSLLVANFFMKKKIAGHGMGLQQLLAFDSSRFKLGYLEVYGGFFVKTNGWKRFIY